MADQKDDIYDIEDVSEEDSLLRPGMLSDKEEKNLSAYNELIQKGFLSTLTYNEYRVWKLFANTKLSVPQISSELHLTIKSVYNLINQVVQKLKMELEDNRDWSRDDKIQEYTKNGLKKGLRTYHKGEDKDNAKKIDKMFKDRVRKHKKEVDEFLKKNPLIRKEFKATREELTNEDN